MYIQSVTLEHFRSFKEKTIITLHPGLNALVGENDCGKSTILDAIRLVLGTTDQQWNRVDITDFYSGDTTQEIQISIKFCDLTDQEKVAFLECMSRDLDKDSKKGDPWCLVINWKARALLNYTPARIATETTCGLSTPCPPPPAEAKELLRVTYLKALRDAQMDMRAGRNSRLSRILASVSDINDGAPYDPTQQNLSSLSLTGILDLSNDLLSKNASIRNVSQTVDGIFKYQMLLQGENLSTQIRVSDNVMDSNRKLLSLLEKLDLTIDSNQHYGSSGLGTSNLACMACELLLKNESERSSFLLIEEPEAHIHAQRQLRLIKSLQKECADTKRQIILTTHSPLLASEIDLKNLILIQNHQAYPMDSEHSALETDDYAYLQKYLDATKANLFFAKAVLIVEGPSEELLFPTIARLLGKDLTEYGVSIVNARGLSLKRFAKIFKRKASSESLNIHVACVTDLDVLPESAIDVFKLGTDDRKRLKTVNDLGPEGLKKRISDKQCEDKGTIQTFISNFWTLEYDLARAGLDEEIREAFENLRYTKLPQKPEDMNVESDFEAYCCSLYKPLYKGSIRKSELAQELSEILEKNYKNQPKVLKDKLPDYIVEAIDHVTTGGQQ